MSTSREKIRETANLIWTIALKDILDSLKNRLILSLILGMGFMLLMPKVIGLVIQPPYKSIIVHDQGDSTLVAKLEDAPEYRLERINSLEELKLLISSMGIGSGTEFGLDIPADFDEKLNADQELEVQGYFSWGYRYEAPQMKSEFEERLSDVLGQPVQVDIEGNTVYPPTGETLLLGMLTMTAVVIILLIGLSLIPHLLFEEKQTKTMEALLVSPASPGHVVLGKALAGLFYVLVTAGVVFAINWNGVVHWNVTLFFVIGCGVFTVALGLVLGSFFERQQEVTGLMTLLIVLFVGTIFVKLVSLDLPAFVNAIIPWVPSVTLTDILQYAFIEKVEWTQIWIKLGSILLISMPLYILVIWKVRQSDR